MYVLGIETSCDETSAAIVKDGSKVLANEVASSLKFHKKYGGIIPEIASRMQLETIAKVADSAMRKSGVKLKDIGLIAVVNGPGLAGSLLVGLSFAKALSLATGAPLIGVDHVHSHIYANFLNRKGLSLPFAALVVSGGHTNLFYIKDFDKIQPLGRTADDACGEAFDKAAKILGLGYPGGPFIERLARSGDAKKIRFNCSGTKRPLDFSFSGIKTAVLYYVQGAGCRVPGKCRVYRAPSTKHQAPRVADIAASFQETVVDTLVTKSLLACKLKRINRLVIGGGVAANGRLRERFYAEAGSRGIEIHFPPPELCTDNAAMVAGLGYQLFRRGQRSDLYLNI